MPKERRFPTAEEPSGASLHGKMALHARRNIGGWKPPLLGHARRLPAAQAGPVLPVYRRRRRNAARPTVVKASNPIVLGSGTPSNWTSPICMLLVVPPSTLTVGKITR